MEVRSCPRCGHVGTGVKHFQRFSHVGVLLGLSVLTWFTFGLGGLAYYVVRRKRMICAQCGLGWQHARIPGPGLAGHPALADPSGTDLVGRGTQFGAGGPLPRGGAGRRVLGVAMILFAALMVMVGAAGGAVEGSCSGLWRGRWERARSGGGSRRVRPGGKRSKRDFSSVCFFSPPKRVER